MENEIDHILQKVGVGIINPVPYDTAIVAWVPKFRRISEPEFPQCLQWLRDNQLEEGSWGTYKPTYSYGNIVSTLAAIIALKKWSETECDLKRVERGERALFLLVKQTYQDKYEPVCYELLIPMLLTHAKRLNLSIPYEDLALNEISELKLKSIRKYQRMHGWNRKHSFWFSLEILGELNELNDKTLFKLSDNILEPNGSVWGSPSASAFYLITKRVEHCVDELIVYQYLENIVKSNKGGAPTLFPIDTFELAWCLSELLMAGFDSEQVYFKHCVDRMVSIWRDFIGLVGCSTCANPDIDVTSVFIFVLNSTQNSQYIENSLEILMNYFNGKYFICYDGERNASISANINALIALKSYRINDSRIKQMIHSVLYWLKTNISGDDFIFEDKWHLSPYYSTSRAVIAFYGIDDDLAQKCIDSLMRRQNADYGWGFDGSTLEETALVTLALCYWFRHNRHGINIHLLKLINQFFLNFNGRPDIELWIGKSLYCPKYVVEIAILSAKYALNSILVETTG